MSALVPGPFFEVVSGSIPPEQKGLTAIARLAKKGDADRAVEEYSKMFKLQADAVVELFRQRNLVTRSESA